MARARRSQANAQTTEIQKYSKTLCDAVNAYIKASPSFAPVIQIAAPIIQCVKYKDGTFKNKLLDAGQEFILESIYPGKIADYICCFTPMDSREYMSVEFNDAKIEGVSNGVLPYLAKAIGFESQGWSLAKVKFGRDLMQAEARATAAEEAKIKQQAESFYAKDELFGKFA